jgi:hypothetical protein
MGKPIPEHHPGIKHFNAQATEIESVPDRKKGVFVVLSTAMN